MPSAKPRLPQIVVGGLLSTILSLAATGIARGQDAPVVPNVPQEDAYQYRALPPQEAAQEAAPAEEEGPERYLETEFLKKRNISTYGWIDAGIGANSWGAPFNGPITFDDRAWQGMMNQLYLVNERTLDTEKRTWDWGGRVDLLYGTDFIYTTARGLDAYQAGDPIGLGAPRWNSSRYYGLAMPQLYGELGYNDFAVKFGHFYTIIGYEVVPAIGNFFYTHAYCMQYGEPFTHTGILTTWTPNDQVTFYNGITNGWDNWDDGTGTFGPVVNPYPAAGSNAAYLGGVTFKDEEGDQSLSITTSSGNENPQFGLPYVGNRSILSTVYSNKLSDKLTYVFQNDNGWQFNASGPPNAFQTAQWYGVNQYLFWNFTDTLVGGMRFEWFRDNDGYRVVTPLRNYVFGQTPYAYGFAGNFWAATWGVNWKPTKNWIIRPELRYDWYSGQPGVATGGNPALPFGNGDRSGQFYGGCDAIWQF
ncbi:MAG: outer membrane beta-barrel protein [Planctomycetaceae bacterium]